MSLIFLMLLSSRRSLGKGEVRVVLVVHVEEQSLHRPVEGAGAMHSKLAVGPAQPCLNPD